jgi:hypothetical protein
VAVQEDIVTIYHLLLARYHTAGVELVFLSTKRLENLKNVLLPAAILNNLS